MNLLKLLQPIAEALPTSQPQGAPCEEDEDGLITLQEAARLLGCTERHVHRHLARGRLTSTREGRNHRLRRSQVEALKNKTTR